MQRMMQVGSNASGLSAQGDSVGLSADGNTAIAGGPADSNSTGAAWVFTQSSGVWSQQGSKLVGTGGVGTFIDQGVSVALSADGNTAIVGGPIDNYGVGAAWVFTQSNGVWTQQGPKLVANDETGAASFGNSVALSADGNTAILGGPIDNEGVGAAWVFTRSNGVWSQQGSKLLANDESGEGEDGWSVALSADGNTAIVGARNDSANVGAARVFTQSAGVWSQQGSKLVGTGSVGGGANPVYQGYSVALSGDGNTAMVGGPDDSNGVGAAWVFSQSGGIWTQQGSKLVGSDAFGPSEQAWSVALSSDGNTAMVGGPGDDGANPGAVWVFTRSGGVWTQQGSKFFGTGYVLPSNNAVLEGQSVALSADASTALVGGPGTDVGAVWVFGPNDLSATPNGGQSPLGVTFRASGLPPPMTYTVAFGDGVTGALTQSGCLSTPPLAGHAGGVQCSGFASHTYPSAGNYLAALMDASGSVFGTATVTVGNSGVVPAAPVGPTPPPASPPVITAPPMSGRRSLGQ